MLVGCLDLLSTPWETPCCPALPPSPPHTQPVGYTRSWWEGRFFLQTWSSFCACSIVLTIERWKVTKQRVLLGRPCRRESERQSSRDWLQGQGQVASMVGLQEMPRGLYKESFWGAEEEDDGSWVCVSCGYWHVERHLDDI